MIDGDTLFERVDLHLEWLGKHHDPSQPFCFDVLEARCVLARSYFRRALALGLTRRPRPVELPPLPVRPELPRARPRY